MVMMPRSRTSKNKYMVLLCGLPGTGKTIRAQELKDGLKNFAVIDQNTIRRKLGIRRMPKTQEETLRAVDRTAARFLNKNASVIIDSVNRHTFRRQQLYGVASACDARVITLEIICPEKTAKFRMRKRGKSDGLLSDPNNTKVYDKIKKLWEDVKIDFRYPGEDHVSYAQFNSGKQKFIPVIVRPEDKKMLRTIAEILEAK